MESPRAGMESSRAGMKSLGVDTMPPPTREKLRGDEAGAKARAEAKVDDERATPRGAATPDFVPLTGADCFLRSFDAESRRKNDASHSCQLVLRLGPGFDPKAFGELLDDVTDANPILHAPIRRRFGLGAPAYRLDRARPDTRPRIELHSQNGPPGAIPELFFGRMNERFSGRRGDLLRFDVVQYDDGRSGTDLAMTWLHMLFDGAGSEVFMRWLGECHRGLRRPDEIPPGDTTRSPGMPEGLSGKERGVRATSWQANMKAMGVPPARSLAGPLRRTPQALRYAVETLDEASTAKVIERAKSKAGFLTPMLFYLAAAIRAHHAIFRMRGLHSQSYVVPLPVNLRPKGSEEAIFRTRVSLLWFKVSAEIVDDFDALLKELKKQRHQSIKEGAVENGVIAMDYARYAPMRLYSHMARRALGGELCSYFFAYTGEFSQGLEDFVGAPVLNGFHAPAVTQSPGSVAAISLFQGRMNISHVFQQDVISDAERDCFRARLLEDLLGSA